MATVNTSGGFPAGADGQSSDAELLAMVANNVALIRSKRAVQPTADGVPVNPEGLAETQDGIKAQEVVAQNLQAETRGAPETASSRGASNRGGGIWNRLRGVMSGFLS
ncbi:MAG TPA: hypothetical protein VJB82_02475 [Candidatus Peribacterales bacterium]|nr:hypothetical protein [Candidatus Peribacterales bacterium]